MALFVDLWLSPVLPVLFVEIIKLLCTDIYKKQQQHFAQILVNPGKSPEIN